MGLFQTSLHRIRLYLLANTLDPYEMREPTSELNSIKGLGLASVVTSPVCFEDSVIRIRSRLTKEECADPEFTDMMYYLLGWIVGDASKGFSRNRSRMRIGIDLSRGHPENVALGDSVCSCIRMLGVPCHRIKDGRPRKRDNYGLYRWLSHFSDALAWMYTSCVGLKPNELTSYIPIKMNWTLSSSSSSRTWLLRGLADSDGGVNLRNRNVVITSEPNAPFVKALSESLGLRASIYFSDAIGYVTIPAIEAAKIGLFNPNITTYRGAALNKLASAAAYKGRWPYWLEVKVRRMICRGFSVSAIRDALLQEDDTFVTLRTLRRKVSAVQREPAPSIDLGTPRLRGV